MYNYTSIKVPKFQSFLGPVKDPLLPPAQRSSGDWATLDTSDALPHLSPTYTGYRDRTFCQGYFMGNTARDIVWDSVRSGQGIVRGLGNT